MAMFICGLKPSNTTQEYHNWRIIILLYSYKVVIYKSFWLASAEIATRRLLTKLSLGKFLEEE